MTMIVPKYWAEAKASQRTGNRSFTARRFGWSDESLEAAQQHAQARADATLKRLVAGEKIGRREAKVPYNGADGVPIREEIIATHGDVIITRNSYGALCLNSPDVLFADIDVAPQPSGRMIAVTIGVLLAMAVAAGALLGQKWVAVVGAVAALVLGYVTATALMKLSTRLAGGPLQQVRARIDRFVRSQPEWQIRLYETPAGFRLLAEHRTFDPNDPEVKDFFTSLHVDPLYARMCANQHCFRARVSPKPWRIGITAHLRPRPGVWPIKSERLPERQRWVQQYERAATKFASCRYLETLGSGQVNAKARDVRLLHDELARATTTLPIA